jgi:hypothetical protein
MNPFQIATEGINPDWSPWLVALRGFGFDVEIEIKPVPKPEGGGSWGGKDRTVWDGAQPYEIIVRIKYKGKTWEQKKFISQLAARSLEKVLVSYRRMHVSVVSVIASINRITKEQISIFVNKINRL